MKSDAEQLKSELVVVQAPMSYAGMTRRLWKLNRPAVALTAKAKEQGPAQLVLAWTVRIMVLFIVIPMIGFGILMVTGWYCIFGLLLVPYRLLRRGSRNRKRQDLQHREQLAAIERQRQP